jgi:hypothetical protein
MVLAEYIAAHRIEVACPAASGGLRAISGGRR